MGYERLGIQVAARRRTTQKNKISLFKTGHSNFFPRLFHHFLSFFLLLENNLLIMRFKLSSFYVKSYFISLFIYYYLFIYLLHYLLVSNIPFYPFNWNF